MQVVTGNRGLSTNVEKGKKVELIKECPGSWTGVMPNRFLASRKALFTS